MFESSRIILGKGRVSGWRRASAIWSLLRPLNLLMFCGGVFLGGFLGAESAGVFRDTFWMYVVGAVAVAAIGGAGNSLNDVLDVNIDRVNRPGRPIASGTISRRTGSWVWLNGSIVGLGLSLWLSATHLLVAGLAVGALVAYSLVLKRVVLAGNLLVALLVAVSLVYGAMIGGAVSDVLIACAFAFLLTLAREVLKDAADAPGDSAHHAHTLASVFGIDAAVGIARVIIAGTIVLTPIPFLFSGYSTLYLLLVLITDVLLVCVLWTAGARHENALDRSTDLLKWAMLVGMVALASANALD